MHGENPKLIELSYCIHTAAVRNIHNSNYQEWRLLSPNKGLDYNPPTTTKSLLQSPSSHGTNTVGKPSFPLDTALTLMHPPVWHANSFTPEIRYYLHDLWQQPPHGTARLWKLDTVHTFPYLRSSCSYCFENVQIPPEFRCRWGNLFSLRESIIPYVHSFIQSSDWFK